MKHLLLISNISKDNSQVLDYAAVFCKHYNSKLHILHISEDDHPVLISSPYYYTQNNVEWTHQLEDKMIKTLVGYVSEILDTEMVHSKILIGNKEDVLKKFINENFIDLIIVGSKDFEKKSEFLDHKNLLVNIVDTPLFVIPEFNNFEPLLNFNFLTNNSEKDIEDIILLSNLFPECEITVTHLETKDTNLAVREKNWRNYVSNKVPGRITHNVISEKIEAYVKNENLAIHKIYDSFVFSTRKRKFWSRLFDPSTTLGYLAGLEMPSIIFKYSE